MADRAQLEEQLVRVEADLDKASHAFEASVQSLAELLGTKDAVRITAAKDSMHLWSETVRSLSEEQAALQRRLEYLTTSELTRGAVAAVKSSSRATWATFWVAVLAMAVTTTAAVVAAIAIATGTP